MFNKSKLIIPHGILQRLQMTLRDILHYAHIGELGNEANILRGKSNGKPHSYLYEVRDVYKKRISKLVKIQTKIKRVKGGVELFTHADLQRIEQFVTSVHSLKGMPEVQTWVRKQKAFSDK